VNCAPEFHSYLVFLSVHCKRNEFSSLSRKGKTFGHWTIWTFLLLVWHCLDRNLSKEVSSARIKCERRNAKKENELTVLYVVLPSPGPSVPCLDGCDLRCSG